MDWAKRMRAARAGANMSLKDFGALCAEQPGGEKLAADTWRFLASLVANEWVTPSTRTAPVFDAACAILEGGQDG